MNRKAILCVDDEAIILMHLVMIHEARYSPRFTLLSAPNAARALEIIEHLATEGNQLLMIVSDWLMPGMMGDEFLVLVNQRFPDIRAIMVSGKTDAQSIDKLHHEAGLVGFLPKPLVKEKLFSLIDQVIAEDEAVVV